MTWWKEQFSSHFHCPPPPPVICPPSFSSSCLVLVPPAWCPVLHFPPLIPWYRPPASLIPTLLPVLYILLFCCYFCFLTRYSLLIFLTYSFLSCPSFFFLPPSPLHLPKLISQTTFTLIISCTSSNIYYFYTSLSHFCLCSWSTVFLKLFLQTPFPEKLDDDKQFFGIMLDTNLCCGLKQRKNVGVWFLRVEAKRWEKVTQETLHQAG